MTVTISVQDDLALRLQTEAANRQISVEELAVTILDEAVARTDSDASWSERNGRRLELIYRSAHQELSAAEQAELDELQVWLDQQYESFDVGLLSQLNQMKLSVAQASSGHSDD